MGDQTRPPHSEPQPDPPLGSWGSGLGGIVLYGSRGGANPNEFGQDPTEFGQLIYDPPPEYPSSARTPPLQPLDEIGNGEDASACALPHESALLHGMLHASRQWLGEGSQPSETLPEAFPQIPFSAMYVGETIPDGMRDYESGEDNPMDEDTPMRGQIHSFTIPRKSGFVIITSWKMLRLHYPKWLWKLAHTFRHSFTRLGAEWMCWMPPCSNLFLCVMKRVSGLNKFSRSVRLFEQISKILPPGLHFHLVR